jgi:hypothetical protein
LRLADHSALGGKSVKRQLKQIALTKAATRAVSRGLQISDHLGQRLKLAGIDLRQILLRPL